MLYSHYLSSNRLGVSAVQAVIVALCFAVVHLQSTSTCAADEAEIPGFFESHCIRCHGADLQEAKFRLDAAPKDADSSEFGLIWSRAYERLNSGEMPPKDEPQPTAEERYAAMEWIARGLQVWDAAQNAHRERVSFKRLTREEYVNTIQDLLGFTYHPTDPGGIPEDPSWHGIERMGTILSLTPSHIERFVSAGEFALKNVMPLSEPPTPWKYEWTAPGIISWSEYQKKLQQDPTTPKHRLLIGPANNWKHYVGGLNQIQIPYPGQFRIRIAASGLRPPGGSVPHVVLYDATIDRTLLEQDIDAPEDKPTVVEQLVWLPKGSHDLVLRNELPGPSPYEPHQRGGAVDIFTSLKNGRSPFLEKFSDEEGHPYVPMLILDSVTIEAVIDPWPPKTQQELLTTGERDANHAKSILRTFASKAFRRPVRDDEIERYLHVVETAQASGLSFEESIRESLLSILCAHDFLFLVEGSLDQPRLQLNDYELASRLSYFLWSTMPDDLLLQKAASGQLKDRETLQQELRRMLADPRSKRFSRDFSRQWLRLNDVGKFPPDKKLYPEYDAGLQRSMVAESQEFFDHVLRNNLGLREFIQSDWTMLNNRLADHYGVPGVVDFGLRPVKLPADSQRGGLLTQASILSMTSDGFRHRPVHRGKWLSEVILGITPPPPPPNAGSIPTPVETEKKTTLRAKLEAHRQNAACAACHAKIDPLGLAFDNYDAIGRWRTVEATQIGVGDPPAIDASGVLPDGRSFSGPTDFKSLLAEDIDLFAEALTEKLATYALRRGLSFSDTQSVREIVARSRANDYTLQGLVEVLVLSDLFQTR